MNTSDNSHIPLGGLRLGLGLGLGLGLALAPPLLHAEDAVEPAPTDAMPHPIVAQVETLIAALGGHGIALDAEADGSALIECVARAADPAARVFNAEAYARFQDQRSGLELQPAFRISISNAVPHVASLDTGADLDVQVGDRLLAIQSASTTNVMLGDALALLRASGGGALTLRVERAGAIVTARVPRAVASLPVIETAEVWPREIGYARVNGLFAGRTRELVDLLRAWEEKQLAGGILDLRGAGGDDLDGVAALAAPFASPGSLLFSIRDRRDNDVDRRLATGADRPARLPLMVLVDESTTGAAEAFAAVATDSLRGVLVIGRPTGGDPLIREGLELDGHTLYIATRRLVTGNGYAMDGRAGATPNLLVTARTAQPEFEPEPGPDRRQRLDEEALDRALRDRVRADPVLQRALDVVLGLKALNIRSK